MIKMNNQEKAPDIVVVGSIVADIPVTLPRDPMIGETLPVESIGLTLGGKAVNQGLQALKLGEAVLIIGKVGEDVLGTWVFDQFTKRGLDTRGLLQAGMTSCAIPMILPDSQYILHIPGANQLLTPEDIESTQDLWTAGKILLIQGEIPVSASIRAAQVAKRRGMVVICDPAPATVMTDQLLQLADILTPNSQELSMLCNSPTLSVEEQARQLWQRYPQLKALIVTLGSEGALLQTDSEMATRIAAPSVTTLDPTAAGDAFNGALAHSLAQGQSLYQAVELGCCAGALAASQKGSSISIASLTQILEMWGEVY